MHKLWVVVLGRYERRLLEEFTGGVGTWLGAYAN
jgi:hypothetical protein